jgi:hypothetical protein
MISAVSFCVRPDLLISTNPFVCPARGTHAPPFATPRFSGSYMAFPLGAQGTKIRSSTDTNENNANAMTVRITMAAKIRAV